MLNIIPSIVVFSVLCSLIEGLVTTIDIMVKGNNVFKTGVRQYSLYGRSSHSYTIKCALNTVVQPHEVSIVKDGIKYISTRRQTGQTRLSTKWEKAISIGYQTRNVGNNYTCRAWFRITCPPSIHGVQCHSVIESDVTVTVEMEPSVASNIGKSVYIGEEMSTTCISSYYSRDRYYCYIQDYAVRASVSNTVVSSTTTISNCTWNRYNYRHVCHKASLDLDIASNLKISLTPSSFSHNVTTLHFNCTSVPPRLMRWTIITDNGDIGRLDSRSAWDIIKVSMNVTITQKPGETILKINETTAGGNGILSVVCSSYDTPDQVSASSHRVLIEECNNGETVAVPSTVAEPSAVTVPSTVTELSTTSTTKTTLMYEQGTSSTYKTSRKTEQQTMTETDLPQHFENQVNNCQSSKESPLNVLLITTSATVVCILAVVVLILLRKLRLAVIHDSSKTCSDADDKGPSETVLHDNPVYESYSETAGSCPGETVENATSLYVNI